ncbi:hypothetical protein ALC53_04626 [Atta colombica]|uniref:Uncharacterized protein n=1 Tax=Atta colombica TaxID=520822 RepID=A0A195BJN4_9HYME|nr:hypothetical protein ALC53_04626 [Atta colombica]
MAMQKAKFFSLAIDESIDISGISTVKLKKNFKHNYLRSHLTLQYRLLKTFLQKCESSLKTHIKNTPNEDIGHLMDIFFVKFLQKEHIEFFSQFSEFSQISDLLRALNSPFSMEPNTN